VREGGTLPARASSDAPEMAFSQGWLEKFKDRHEIKSFRRLGESGALDMEAVGVVLPDIHAVVDVYAEKDVFNMDETSLCWRLQADNSLATHQLEGRKINKERITLVICANSDNSEKIPLTIIGKHLNPRCFKGINRDTLGARYHANAKAWMTQDVFQLWLLDFDRRMQGRQVLLLLDNCPGHPLGEVCGDERGPSQHQRFLPAAKHDLGSPTLRCWDHMHIQSILQKAIQQPTSR
jgi:hypothetical protein